MRSCIGNTSGGFQKGCLFCLAGIPKRQMVQVVERDEKGRSTGRYFFMDKAVLDAAIEKGSGK